MQDIKLLQQIHQSAELGKLHAENALRNTNDPALRQALHRQYRKYQDIYGTSANYLIARGIPPKSAKLTARINSHFSIGGCRSASDLASGIIKQENGNLAKSKKMVQNYKGDDPLVLALAKDLKHAGEQSLEKMQGFL